jgi:hypothetical protein
MAGLNNVASELESIARELRRQADGELFRELTEAMRRGVEPAKEQVRAGLDAHLPDRYADELNADLDLAVSVSTAGREPGVSLLARSGRRRSLRRIDAGQLRHPGPGNDREHWYTQEVHPGWFTGPCRDADPEVTRQLEAALERVADQVDAKAAARG